MAIFSIIGWTLRIIGLVLVIVIGLGMVAFFGAILLLLCAIPILFAIALL